MSMRACLSEKWFVETLSAHVHINSWHQIETRWRGEMLALGSRMADVS